MATLLPGIVSTSSTWANAAVTLGMIGGEQAVDPLLEFIDSSGAGAMSRERYTALTSAILALGYVVHDTGSEQVLDYLAAAVLPEIWADKNVGMAPYHSSSTERDFDLSKFAVLALAVSGDETAAEILRSLQEPADTEVQGAFQAQYGDFIGEALEEHAKVAGQGLSGYYRRR